MEEKLDIKAEICEFLSGNLIFDYDDGSFEHFDGVKLKIIEPPPLSGKEMIIYTNDSSEHMDKWKKVGLMIKFSIKRVIFESNEHIFEGALQDLVFL
ncbi:MAG: hypothetical protein ACFFCS_27655 [Candidatus Hodarchaeota archaeon]